MRRLLADLARIAAALGAILAAILVTGWHHSG